jgi:hypothetical protein
MILTRRKLATVLTCGVALAQTAPQPPGTPEQEIQAARDRIKANAAALAAQPLPMATEPAFQFKA